jgi:hypothetical protein
MILKHTLLFLLAAVLTVGCQTRSISNSDYRGTWGYRGELSELEVLGVNSKQKITEADIQVALKADAKISLKRGDRIVLVQSGAQFPDGPVLEEMKPYYSVVPLSGVPAYGDRYVRYGRRGQFEDAAPQQPIDKSLRLAAAKAGAKTLIVYWGILETGREDHGSKIISWVPIVGKLIPDQKQKMRIRIKAAVIDVATGAWEFIIPEAYNDARTSARINREESDQGQVVRLKTKAYKALVTGLLQKYN